MRQRFTNVVALCLLALAVIQPAHAAKDGPDPIVIQDPHYGEVLFYFYQDDYFPAIVRLLSGQQQQLLNDHLDQSELLLGGMGGDLDRLGTLKQS